MSRIVAAVSLYFVRFSGIGRFERTQISSVEIDAMDELIAADALLKERS